MILRPPREAIAVSTPNPGRWLPKAMGFSKTYYLVMRSSIVRRDGCGGAARVGEEGGHRTRAATPRAGRLRGRWKIRRGAWRHPVWRFRGEAVLAAMAAAAGAAAAAVVARRRPEAAGVG